MIDEGIFNDLMSKKLEREKKEAEDKAKADKKKEEAAKRNADREKRRQEAKAEAVAQTDGGASLARIDSALATLDGHAKAVDDYIARNLNVRSSSASYTGNQDARQAGTRAGANINIGGAAGQIGRGHAALGRG